ncbi:MAG: CD225/dispanin family protein [Myxococcales bacterium]
MWSARWPAWPAAIFIIIYAVQAKTAKDQGDLETARSKVKTASLVAYIVIALGFLGILANIIIRIVAS